jgi:flagellar FliL protein
MAEDKNSGGDDAKKKLPIVPILIGVLVVLLVAVGAVFATLMLTGGFSEEEIESELAEIENAATAGASAESGAAEGDDAALPLEPQLMVTPTPPRLATLYYEMQRPLTANLVGSRRVMQVTIAIMTHYDQLVVDNILKHELAIRSALLTVLSNTPEENLDRADFRIELGEEMRISINAVLEQFENFGGVESVYFTEFLIQ